MSGSLDTVAEPSSAGDLDPDWVLIFCGWLLATGSTLGSLFFSNVMDYPPCILCWYQRICLFPLVIILGRALFPLDRAVVRYALPLAVVGWLLAAYHNLLYSGIVPAGLQPCAQGVSCTEPYLLLFGFISIPLLALLSFTALTGILFVLKKRSTM
ncbi:MAG: disulfide bond formation protein B [bacterium]|nr:disulfide bond formation protein B [bacterium]